MKFAEGGIDNDEVRKYYFNKYRQDPPRSHTARNRIHCDPSAAEVLARYGLEAKKYFLFVGRLVPEKGVHELMKAYKRMNTEYPLSSSVTTGIRPRIERATARAVRQDPVPRFSRLDHEQLLVNALVYVSASRLEGTAVVRPRCGRGSAPVNGIEENHVAADGAALMFDRTTTKTSSAGSNSSKSRN